MNLLKKLAFSWPHFEVFMVNYVSFGLKLRTSSQYDKNT